MFMKVWSISEWPQIPSFLHYFLLFLDFLREPGIHHTVKLSTGHTGSVERTALIFQTAIILIFPLWPDIQVPEPRTEPSLITPTKVILEM